MTERVPFIVRNAEGVVVRTGTTTPSSLHLQAREGETVEEGHAEQIEIPEVVPLDRLKARAVARVNRIVDSIRAPYLTDILGQQLIYDEKRKEAVAYLAEVQEPADLTDYPFLADEVGVTAPTAYELAQLWLNMNTLWKQLAAATEGSRRRAIDAIEAAPDAAAVEAVLTAFPG